MQTSRTRPAAPMFVASRTRRLPRLEAMTAARLLLIVVSMVATLMPLFPDMPDASLDGAWRFAMNEAVARGLVIGRDIVFTFGPYAAVYTHLYHPVLFPVTLFATGYLVCLYCISLSMLTAKLSFMHLALICFLIASCRLTPDAVLYVFPLMVGLVVVNAAAEATIDRLGFFRICLLFTGLGLLILVKGSLVPLCMAITAISAVPLVLGRHTLVFVGACASALISTLFFWLAAGQPLLELASYFQTLVPTVVGYTEAMSLFGPMREAAQYLLGAAALILIVLRSEEKRRARWLTIALMSVYLFLAFKGGFVRQDGHVLVVSISALLLAAVLTSARFPSGWSFATFASIAAMFAFADMRSDALPNNLASRAFNTYTDLGSALVNDLDNRHWRAEAYSTAVARIKTENPLSADISDVYPWNESSVIAFGGPWNPRPVIQSYGAYTPVLLGINAAHLTKQTAPHRVQFSVMTIDGRLPSLDDGASWPVLVTNYRVVEQDGDRLTLERSKTGANHDTRSYRTTSARLDEEVPVPAGPDLTWARVEITQSLLGKLASIVYKPPLLEIELHLSDGKQETYRFIASMARTDFLLSPSVSTTPELGRLFTSTERLANRRVVSFRIRTRNSWFHAWRSEYRIEFRQL